MERRHLGARRIGQVVGGSGHPVMAEADDTPHLRNLNSVRNFSPPGWCANWEVSQPGRVGARTTCARGLPTFRPHRLTARDKIEGVEVIAEVTLMN